MIFSITAIGSSAAKSNIYYCPKAEKLSTIDGKISEDEWKNALTVELDSLNAKASNGWASNPSGTDDAKATVRILWSDDSKYGGLYMSWHVTDVTQSFALDKISSSLNSMDCVQIVIDPMYQRRAKVRDSAMIYTFVPYLSRSGNGFAIYRDDGATWYEHIYWVGRNESLGVRVESNLDAVEDTETDRKWLVRGYDIEAYLPWKALTVLTGTPEAKVGTQMGIGFLLVDYTFDYENYSADYKNGTLKDVPNYQKLVNMTTDFSNGTRTTQENICAYPRNYNTLVLTDFNAQTTSVNNPDTADKPDDVTANESESLEEILKKDEQLNGADYTPETWEVYSAAFEEAKAFINGESKKSEDEIKNDLIAAIEGLKLRYDLDSSSEESEAAQDIAKLTELINSTRNLKDKYTEEQLAKVEEKLLYATELLSKPNPGREQISAAYNALNAAIHELPERDVITDGSEYGTEEYLTIGIVSAAGTVSAVIVVFVVLSVIKRSSKKKTCPKKQNGQK